MFETTPSSLAIAEDEAYDAGTQQVLDYIIHT